jgi:hypothetical protein
MGQEARVFDAAKAQVLSNLAEMLVRQLEAKWVASLQVGVLGVCLTQECVRVGGWGWGIGALLYHMCFATGVLF